MKELFWILLLTCSVALITMHLISSAVYSNSELDFKTKFRIGDFWDIHQNGKKKRPQTLSEIKLNPETNFLNNDRMDN